MTTLLLTADLCTWHSSGLADMLERTRPLVRASAVERMVEELLETRHPDLAETQVRPLGNGQQPPGAAAVAAASLTSPSVELVETLLAGGADTHVIIAFDRCENYLAAALQGEASAEAGLDQWLQAARGLLKIFRRHRKQVSLVDAGALRVGVPALCSFVSTRLGLDLTPHPAAATTAEERSEPEALNRLVAAYLTRSSAEVTEVSGALQASALPIAAPEDQDIDVSRLLEDHCAMQSELIAQLTEQRIMLREERDRLDRLSRECEQALANRTQAEDSLASLRDDNELMLRQLHQAQEELERTYVEVEDLRLAEAELNKRAEQAEEKSREMERQAIAWRDKAKARERDVESIKRSLSWKTTAPLRALASPFMGGSEK